MKMRSGGWKQVSRKGRRGCQVRSTQIFQSPLRALRSFREITSFSLRGVLSPDQYVFGEYDPAGIWPTCQSKKSTLMNLPWAAEVGTGQGQADLPFGGYIPSVS